MSSVFSPSQPASLADFDRSSGSWIERLLFNHRLVIVALCVLVTGLLGWQTTKLQLNASFEKIIPTKHPYIQNFLHYQRELTGLGNAVRVAVENPKGSIYEKEYLETLRGLSDEVFLIPGVNRNQMKSLWTPTMRWVSATEDGLEGGPVIPDGYDGGSQSLMKLEANVARSGEIGQLVATDARSTIIFVPLNERTPDGKTLDYAEFSNALPPASE